MSSKIAIDVQGLSKCYNIYNSPQDRLKQTLWRGKRQYYSEFWALRDINFTVAPGETVGIVGRNGSGKSTLLQIICGTLRPTSGTVKTQGRIAALLELGAGFNPEFTGRENAVLNAQILGVSVEEINDRMHDIESFANIGDFFDRPVKTYSSGMYVRVAFAVQACISPDILIVDEALAVGDEKFQRKCYDRFEELRDKGTSILFVTHSTTAVERFCQRAVMLHQGCVHGVGPSNEIIDQYHALLYSDEKAYLKHLNRLQPTDTHIAVATSDQSPNRLSEGNEAVGSNSLANIISVEAVDAKGETCEVFAPQETVSIQVTFEATNYIDELQTGISIRTVEGVHAFGTSTLYKDKNSKGISAGEIVKIEFKFPLNLSNGVYFISAAIAQPISQGSMKYIDKRSDSLMLKVSEPHVNSTGITYMKPEILETRLK
ncbi:ABC transporter ATP-binding protein [Paraburkholderia aspalathi]|nr:ABC transporter ATP-binding protein [Paraburkholderia aspalathi]